MVPEHHGKFGGQDLGTLDHGKFMAKTSETRYLTVYKLNVLFLNLGGGFKYFLFSPLLGEDFHPI